MSVALPPGTPTGKQPHVALPKPRPPENRSTRLRNLSIWEKVKELRNKRDKAEEAKTYCNANPAPEYERPEMVRRNIDPPPPPRPLSDEEHRRHHLRKLQDKINPTMMLKIGEELANDDKITYEKLVAHYEGIKSEQINTAGQLAFSVAYDKASFMKYFKFFYEGYL